MKQSKTRTLTECAILVALATVLSLIKVWEAPLGGAVTLGSMVPIILIVFRHGMKWCAGSAFVYSILQCLLGSSSIAWLPTAKGVVLCILLDYLIAFSVLCLAGVFIKTHMTPVLKIILGTLTACVARYIVHVLSGAVVWYEITKAGNWNELVHKLGMWSYSAVYNMQFMLPETIMTVILVPLAIAAIPQMRKNYKLLK